jgi:hypothetical protein
LVKSELENMSVTWNSVTITYSNKFECINRKFSAHCHNRFFFLQNMEYHYDNFLEKLNLLTLHFRRRHSDALLIINIFSGAKCCPSVLETAGILVPARDAHNFTTFTHSSSQCPAARRVSPLIQFVNIQITLQILAQM